MRRVYLFLLLTVAFILVWNPAYTLFAIVAQGTLPGSVINALKFTPYILLLSVLAGALWYRVSRSGWHSIKAAPLEVKLAAALLVWSTLTVAYSSAVLWQSLRGVNVDFAGIILFLAIWLLQPKDWEGRRLRWVMLITLAALALLSIPEIFFNHDYRVWSGHRLDNHYVTGTIPQLRSLTSGPNPFGTLMILLSVLVVTLVKNPRLVALAMVPIGGLFGLTHARSAWVGAAVMGAGLFFYLLFKRKRFILWPLVLGASILFGAISSSFFYNETIWNVLTHGTSTEEHGETASEAIGRTSKQNLGLSIMGYGVGTAGPVVFGTAEGSKDDLVKIVESWYIQIFQEIGLIGLVLYVWLYVLVTKLLLKQNLVLGFMAIGLGINAITLHIWSADANLNLMFWALAAVALYGWKKPERT